MGCQLLFRMRQTACPELPATKCNREEGDHAESKSDSKTHKQCYDLQRLPVEIASLRNAPSNNVVIDGTPQANHRHSKHCKSNIRFRTVKLYAAVDRSQQHSHTNHGHGCTNESPPDRIVPHGLTLQDR